MPNQFAEQLKKLDALRLAEDFSALEEFDEEAEQLIIQRFGDATPHLEAYELAIMGEAETIVNVPQSAQEDTTQDLFQKSIEQRRQVLQGCLADAGDMGVGSAARVVSPVAAQERPVVTQKKKPAPKKTPVQAKAKANVKVKPKPKAKATTKTPIKQPAASKQKNRAPAKKKRTVRG